MTTDRIELRGLQVRARCGVLPEERTRDQPLEVDLDLEVDLATAGASDALADTVDYGAVCDAVEGVCASVAPQLLEHLAELIASAVLEVGAGAGTPLESVTVGVRKLRPPVPQMLATSGVRITRPRRGDAAGRVTAPDGAAEARR
ncbi:MAG: dihydroneopterin aldolase [Actinobacteria bacterium]|nr:dihydroneopterin aldolase [Actinomycetota bacterium]